VGPACSLATVHGAVDLHRGPRPWRREPRTDADRLVIVAWCQLGGFVAWSAMLALYAWFLYVLRSGVMACFDGTEPACTAPAPSLAPLVAPAAMWSLVMALAVAAVVVGHRHRRGAASLPATLVLLAAAPVAALVAERVAGVPLPFFV